MFETTKIEQVCFEDLAFEHLDIFELQLLFWTHDILFQIDLGPMEDSSKKYHFLAGYWFLSLNRFN